MEEIATQVQLALRNIADMLAYDPETPMLFSSGIFWLLFIFFLPVYALLKKSRTKMVIFVVGFSLYFYYKSSGLFFLMLAGTSAVDWMLSWHIFRSRKKGVRLALMWLSVCFSLSILGYFKYANFFLWNWNAMVQGNFQPMDIILPVGISFYTFQSVSYVVDVYKRRIAPTRSWLDYIFYLSFFPQLVAGPIVRADYFLPQLRRNERATPNMIWGGLWLIIVGIIKKALIADYIAQYNDLVFNDPGFYTGLQAFMGVIGYTMQIYCDFSGYSDMAIGLALLLGFRFPDNFNAPFKSQSPSEFWHRWHISLSSWLRDYVYIPLGGNRKGVFRTYLNNFLTMLIGGLWHGASWMYLFWGGYQGVLLIGHQVLKKAIPSSWYMKPSTLRRALNIFVTFVLALIGFGIFRSMSMQGLGDHYQMIFTNFHPEIALEFISAYSLIVFLIVLALIMHFTPSHWRENLMERYLRMPLPVQSITLAAVLFIVVQTRNADLVPFIYLQY